MSLLTWDYDRDLFCLSEARMLPGGASSMPASPAPGPTAVTVLAYAPEEEKPAEVYFDATQTLPFAVLQRFVTLVASRLASTGS